MTLSDLDLERWAAEVVCGWIQEEVFGMLVYRTGDVNKYALLPTDIDINDWHPLQDANQIFGPGMVIDKMLKVSRIEMDFMLEKIGENQWKAHFFDHGEDLQEWVGGKSDNPLHAILEAAYQALGGRE